LGKEPPAGCYRLRAGVQLARAKDGRWTLRDRGLRRALRLGEQDARLLRQLGSGDGQRLDQLEAALGAGGAGGDSGDVRRRLSALARLYLLAGPRATMRLKLASESKLFAASLVTAAADREADAAAIAVHFPPGRDPPRHRCVATGACCSASFLGPMSDADRVRVGGLRLGRRARVDKGIEALESVEFRGQELWGMRRMAGRCVALGDDGLCDLHAEHGYDIKPIPCRQFPLRFHRTPWGLHVSLLLACEGYDRARGEAGAWATREAEVRGFLAEGAHVPASTLPFEWSAGLPASVADTRQLLDALLAGFATASDAGAACPRVALAAVIRDFERAALGRAGALSEGVEVATEAAAGFATAGLAAALDGDAAWFDDERLGAHLAHLADRAVALAARDEPADAERLQCFSVGVEALRANLQAAPRGDFRLSALARRHLLDVIHNDLPAQIALGQLDAGLANLAHRLRFIEALACAFCAADGGRDVTPRHSTLALKVAYRSEPDITALAAAWPRSAPSTAPRSSVRG